MSEIHEHALEEYPHECFGIVVAREKGQTVYRFENVQDKIRGTDPARYTDSRTGYFVDRKYFDEIISSIHQRGEVVIAFYHSHPDHEAYFSTTDVEAQTVFGDPEFPEAYHVVVSVMNGSIADVKCYRWEESRKRFSPADDFLKGPA